MNLCTKAKKYYLLPSVHHFVMGQKMVVVHVLTLLQILASNNAHANAGKLHPAALLFIFLSGSWV
jgi:hypothetical protein